MSSVIEGYNYDIFISYRQKDNKYDGWVTEFVNNLKKELEATFKEDITIYFDENPHDGLLETHIVDKSLEEKLKCLVFIPVVSQTYCDVKSYAWRNEFCVFNRMVNEDRFGRDIIVTGGNYASRILPVKINELDPEDTELLENEIGGFLRPVEFIYREPGVNRPLTPNDDEKANLSRTKYRNQINKVANAIKELIKSLVKEVEEKHSSATIAPPRKIRSWNIRRPKLVVLVTLVTVLLIAGLLLIPNLKLKLTGSSLLGDKSIAVLPFVNLNNDPDMDYFSYGLVDEILDRLCKIGELKVISHTSSSRYKNTGQSLKEIASELGVSAVLEGSVMRNGNNMRISTQLIDAKTDTHVWSGKFDRDFSEIFSVYSEVAQAVAKEMRILVTPDALIEMDKSTTSNILAYEAYLMGRYHIRILTREDLEIAMQFFNLAKERDPGFALAYAGIGRTWRGMEQMGIVRPSEATSKAEEALLIALKLDTTYSEVYHLLGGIKTFSRWDWKEGEKAFRKALELNPENADAHSTFSHLLMITGRSDEALSHIEIAMNLDPLNEKNIAFYGGILMFLSRYDEAVSAFRKSLEMSPAQSVASSNIVPALVLAGKLPEAMEMQRLRWTKNPEYLKILDEGYAESGFRGACKQLADYRAANFETVYSSPFAIAVQYSMAGDTSNTLLWLEKAFEEHNPNMPYILSPVFKELSDNPRYLYLVRKMNLPL